jgi:hypothetical protein
MRFILMMTGGTPGPGQGIESWSKEAIGRHTQFMLDFNRGLKARGALVDAQGLDYPPRPKIVRATRERKPSVTDGPFPETKEYLFGYWIVQVESADQAYEIAAQASAAPGPDGQPLNMPIEVRQVMEAPPSL